MPAVTEAERLAFYEHARQTFGPHTETLMNMLPPDTSNLATKDDLAVTRAELRGEMSELRAEFAELRAEFKVEMSALRFDVREDIHAMTALQNRNMLIGILGAVLLLAISDIVTTFVG